MTDPIPLPTSTSSLMLPSASRNVFNTISALKRSHLSITNRLHSIYRDSSFVQEVASSYDLPLIANERCGSWYIPPDHKVGSAYFKSTDGHWGQWSFSTRRLNLQILSTIGRSGGCIIVDSTRRGKRMPDALSKTIPIWCIVLNRLLFEDRPESHILQTPRETVDQSEHSQIESRVASFTEEAKALDLDIPALRSILRKPLRPLWVTPNTCHPAHLDSPQEYHFVVCCTASHLVEGTELSENGYIQGAGDDSEGWSRGLTPTLFWAHKQRLLEATEESLEATIVHIIHTTANSSPKDRKAVRVGLTNLHIGALSDSVRTSCYDGIIICSDESFQALDLDIEKEESRKYLHLPCGEGKLGSRALRSHLPRVPSFVASLTKSNNAPLLLFASSQGKDLSIGVALAVLCLFFDDEYNYSPIPNTNGIDKALIRRRLAYITTADPDANPSRSTLQSVHSFLMPRTK